MNEIFFILLVNTLGFILVNAILQKDFKFPDLIFTLPSGLAIWFIVSSFTLTLDINYSLSFKIFYLLIFVGLCFQIFKKKSEFPFKELALSTIVITILFAFFYLLNIVNLTFDSFRYIQFGKYLAVHGLPSAEVKHELADFGFGITSIQSASIPFKYEFSHIIFQILGINLALLVFVSLTKHFINVNWKQFIFPILFLITTPHFIFQFFYVHTNLLTTTLLISIYLSAKQSLFQKKYLNLMFIYLFGLNYIRIETPIVGAILIYCLSFALPIAKANFKLVITNILFFFAWQGTLLSWMDGTAEIGTPKIFTLMSLIFLIANIFIFKRDSLGNSVKKYLTLETSLYALFTILIVLIFVDTPKMSRSIWSTWWNLIEFGPWGVFWISFLILIFAKRPRIAGEVKSIAYFIFIYFLFIESISFFRPPYRIGFGDSANRMLFHLAPFALILMFSYIFSTIRSVDSKLNS